MHRRDDSYKILHPTANMSLRVTQYPCKSYNNNNNNNASMNGNTLAVAHIGKKKKNQIKDKGTCYVLKNDAPEIFRHTHRILFPSIY